MPEIQIPSIVITGLQVILAFIGAFIIALWVSMIVWTFRDARSRSRDIFSILLASLMVIIFGPLGLLLYLLLRPPVTLAELYERSLEEEALLQDLEQRPRCPGCSRQVKDEWIVCPDCHTSIKNICQQCEHPLHLAWTICPYCATPTAAAINGHDHLGSATKTQPIIEPAVVPALVGNNIFAPPQENQMGEPDEVPAGLPTQSGQQETRPMTIPGTEPVELNSVPPPPIDETQPHMSDQTPA